MSSEWNMTFEPVNLDESLALCLAFRRDAHALSHGSDRDFNIEACTAWFRWLKSNNPSGFEHAILNDRIVGQLEYRLISNEKNGPPTGYINLIYILPEHRRSGFGFQLQEHVFSRFLADGCSIAHLRYLPENVIAGSFYHKNGWCPQGAPDARGQLMTRNLA